MKKKNYIIILLLIALVIESVYLLVNKNKTSEFEDDNLVNTIKKEDTLSFMLETSYGSGEYKEGTSTKWPLPSDGYIFNAILSKCQNGGELGWDDENNVVTMTGNMSDKCYVYFDAVQKAVINEITTSDITTTSMTITINAAKGTFDISKYYYSIDGTIWNESSSNVIPISGLTMGTEYTIKTYVQDNKGINSEYKSVSVSTITIPYYFEIGTKLTTASSSYPNRNTISSVGNLTKGAYVECHFTNFELTDSSFVLVETYFHACGSSSPSKLTLPVFKNNNYLYTGNYYVISTEAAACPYYYSYRFRKEGYQDICINAYKKEIVDCNNEKWMYTGIEETSS